MMLPSKRWRLVLGGGALFAAGAGMALLLLRPAPVDRAMPAAMDVASTAAPSAGAPSAVIVEIPTDAAARAGLVDTEVVALRLPATTRIPATVEPNQYGVVAVTAPAGGRVLRVVPQLGDRVAAGSPLVVMHSPELARAAADQAAATAALSAADRELERTRKLVAIGAASRREVEEREAERADALARVEAARSEVRLLGGGANRSGEMTVRAAAAGVVTERAVNPGVVVERGAPLLTTASLSPVWVIGELAEADMARVRIGDRATIRSDAYPGLDVSGRVTYIAPEVRRETRTAQIRIETPNEGGRLRFGMLVEARLESNAGGETPAVPAAAMQRIGAATVVYVAVPGSRSKFEERKVEIGTERDGMVTILSGLRAGERVVSTGSFFVRAEADRQGLRSAATAPHAHSPSAAAAPGPTRVIPISVDAGGFTPSRVALRRGEQVILRFTRVTESCATEVVVPPSSEKRPLPLKQAVDVPFAASRPGEFTFSCGMNMLKGSLVVQ